MHKKSAQKNLIIAVIIAITAIFFTISCAKSKEDKKPGADFVEIEENLFLTQVNDVYLNAKDYIGKTIKLEGIFLKEQPRALDEPNCYIVRYGPGCCGNDGLVGFEVIWDKNKSQTYPESESWVEARGVLKVFEKSNYLYLDLSSLTVLNKRGRETVVR